MRLGVPKTGRFAGLIDFRWECGEGQHMTTKSKRVVGGRKLPGRACVNRGGNLKVVHRCLFL